MKDFLVENWKFLVEILLVVLSIIIVLVKKKASIVIPISLFDDLYRLIPEWIIAAEDEVGPGNGDKKLSIVLKKALLYVSKQMDVAISDIPASFSDCIIAFVEDILSTPTKKKGIE